MICCILFQKCLLQKSTSWWRCNRAIWNVSLDSFHDNTSMICAFCSINVYYKSQPSGGAITGQCKMDGICSLTYWESGCKMSHKSQAVLMIWGLFIFQMGQSLKLWKPILANQDGIWKIGLIHYDYKTIEILFTDLRYLWTKYAGVSSKNVFSRELQLLYYMKELCEH